MIRKLIFFLFVIFTLKTAAQEVKGYIYSAEGTPLAGASVYIKELSKGTYSTEKGYFEIKAIPAGNYSVEISYVGYKRKTFSVSTSETDSPLKIYMSEDAITTKQVIVTASKHEESIAELPVSALTISLLQ